MLKVVTYKTLRQHSDLLLDQYRLRHQEFIERQRYDVHSIDGMEFDEYDTLAAVYLVYTRDGRTALGVSRLTPVDYGCMLADHFPELVDDASVFSSPRTWEGTRFCIDRNLSPDLRSEICHAICAGYLEYAMARGIDRIIGLMPTLILRSVFERSGIDLDRLGPVHRIGAHSRIQAASIAVTPEQLERVTARTGIRNVLGYNNEGLAYATQ